MPCLPEPPTPASRCSFQLHIFSPGLGIGWLCAGETLGPKPSHTAALMKAIHSFISGSASGDKGKR